MGLPVLIDTDMGIDYWMAITYLLLHKGVDVKGITVTAAGLSHCDLGLENVLNLLTLTEHSEIPIACGRDTPLRGTHTFPMAWRDLKNIRDIIELPCRFAPSVEGKATDLLGSIIESSSEQTVIVALGPLTNLAELLSAEPSLIKNLSMMYIMGGAVAVNGNIAGFEVGIENEVAEWNIYIDPFAATTVFQSGAPITLIPLDATNHVPVTRSFLKRLKQTEETPSAKFVYRVLAEKEPLIERDQYFFWDPLAAAIATDESLATFQRKRVRVIEDEGPNNGAIRVENTGSEIRIATAADATRFEKHLIDVLNSKRE